MCLKREIASHFPIKFGKCGVKKYQVSNFSEAGGMLTINKPCVRFSLRELSEWFCFGPVRRYRKESPERDISFLDAVQEGAAFALSKTTLASCRHRKKSFFSFLLSILLDSGLILCFPTPTPIGLDESHFLFVLCAGVNILCKHVQMCVCVCVLRQFVDMAMGTNNQRFGVATNHREILRCDWSPMSTNFIILIKTCINTGSGTRDRFRDLVMRG